MTDTTDVVEMIDPVTGEIIDQKQLAEQLLAQAKAQGMSLVGPGGLLSGLTKQVLESALEAELTEHLGHEHGAAPLGMNMRNGSRSKTVLTEIGPVEIEVPRDRDGSFTPVMARVLIIGGHGKVAMLLAPLLVARGGRVTAVIRNPEHGAEVAATGAVPVVADSERLDLAGFTDLLSGHDAVVWSAGAGGGAPARTRAVDQDAAIRAIQATAAAGIDRFVMVSYLAARLDHEVPQDHPFFAYAQAKAAADAFLRGSGLEWTILAPGPLTLGEPTGLIETVSPGEGRVSRADVAAVAAAVLTDPSTIRRTLSFGAGATPIAQAISFAEGVPAQG